MANFSSDQTRLTLASCNLSFAGLVLKGIQKISLSDTLDGDPVYANDSVSVGLPAGTHKGEGSLALLSEMANMMRQNLGPNWMRIPGALSLSLFEPLGTDPITYNATRVYLRKVEADFGEPGGSKPVVETFGLIILDPIDWDGAPGVANGITLSLPGLAITF